MENNFDGCQNLFWREILAKELQMLGTKNRVRMVSFKGIKDLCTKLIFIALKLYFKAIYFLRQLMSKPYKGISGKLVKIHQCQSNFGLTLPYIQIILITLSFLTKNVDAIVDQFREQNRTTQSDTH
jgi:hypothetical protein